MDYTTITTENDISLLQIKVTNNTNNLIITLFDYLHTNPSTKLKFCKSNIILKVHSSGLYLSVMNSRSRAAGYYYMGDNIHINIQEKPQAAI